MLSATNSAQKNSQVHLLNTIQKTHAADTKIKHNTHTHTHTYFWHANLSYTAWLGLSITAVFCFCFLSQIKSKLVKPAIKQQDWPHHPPQNLAATQSLFEAGVGEGNDRCMHEGESSAEFWTKGHSDAAIGHTNDRPPSGDHPDERQSWSHNSGDRHYPLIQAKNYFWRLFLWCFYVDEFWPLLLNFWSGLNTVVPQCLNLRF